ncbi:MAG: hypothetical protein EBR34_06760 [Sphingomonadaceae bacterium]|nr:hypothetical protein [Sphingomonadaceae bacterium]
MSGSQIMVVLIVLIASVASIVRARHGIGRSEWRSARRQGRMDGPAADPLALQREAELQREVQDLRERVKVLERIATDGRSTAALANEIESLRGPQD